MLISHKRAMLARLLDASGLLRGLELFARKPGLLVLGYHRIGTVTDTNEYPGVYSASADDFQTQMVYLKKRFRVVSLDEVLAMGPELKLNEPCVMVTFDDGYRDNYDVALPILAGLEVPATFFLPTDFLDAPHLFWWDRLTLILKQTSIEHIQRNEPMTIDLNLSQLSREEAIARAVCLLLAANPNDVEPWLDRLEAKAQVAIEDEALARPLLMGWNEARALLSAGMSVGSHGRSHRNLAGLDEVAQRDEITDSKARLEAELGGTVNAIAYPYGVATAFTETTCRLANEAGYRIGFGFGGGINRPGKTPPFALARINVGHSDTPSLFRSRAVMMTAFGKSPL